MTWRASPLRAAVAGGLRLFAVVGNSDAAFGHAVHRRTPFMFSHRWRGGHPWRTHATSSSARQNRLRRPIRTGTGSRPVRFQMPTVWREIPNALAVARTFSNNGGGVSPDGVGFGAVAG
ncbi:MAG: hypothetical protein FWE88_09760 [Phycisphaerae bacterium]|nr:hypothetical protein [Phycisphaerae bacterium]